MKAKNLMIFAAAMATTMIPTLSHALSITEGAGWTTSDTAPPAFYWDSLGTPNTDGAFTYSDTGISIVSLTDVIAPGDQFELFDHGISVGTTPVVPVQLISGIDDPNAAWLDPKYSHASFVLPAGSHSLTIQAIGNSFDAGKGYVKVDHVPDTGSTALMLAVGLSGICLMQERRRRLVS